MRLKAMLFGVPLLAAVAAAGGATLPSDYGAVDIDSALKKSAADGKPIMLFVSSGGCGPCGRASAMLASSNVSKIYIDTANFVDVDAATPPDWFLEMNRKSGIRWVRNYGRYLWRPSLVFLTNKGEYMCTLTGLFNNSTHALNVIREVKALSVSAGDQASTTFRDCPGSQI